MRIVLKRTWITPLGGRLKKGVHTVPSFWRDKLPTTAKVVKDNYVEPEKKPPMKAAPQTLSELNAMDIERASDFEADALRREAAEDEAAADQAKTNRQAGAARARAAKKEKANA